LAGALAAGTSDSEGTLGGLVQVGKRIDRILASALEFGRLCSNDPFAPTMTPRTCTRNFRLAAISVLCGVCDYSKFGNRRRTWKNAPGFRFVPSHKSRQELAPLG